MEYSTKYLEVRLLAHPEFWSGLAHPEKCLGEPLAHPPFAWPILHLPSHQCQLNLNLNMNLNLNLNLILNHNLDVKLILTLP